MTCICTFSDVASGVTNIKAPKPGVALTLKNSPLFEVSGSANASLGAASVSGTLNLTPGSITASAKPDKEGKLQPDIVVSPALAAFGANLKIWPLQGGKFEFDITRPSWPSGSTVGFKYGSDDRTAHLTLKPKFAIGGVSVGGSATFSGFKLPAGSLSIDVSGVTVRGVICPKDPRPFKLAGFYAATVATAGIGTSFAGHFDNPQLSLFLKIAKQKLELSTIANIPFTGKPEVELRIEKKPGGCPCAKYSTDIGAVIKYAADAVTWGAGAKFGCNKSGGSLALEYTAEKSLLAVIALPECARFKSKATLSAAWKTLNLSTALLKPAVGLSFVIGQ